MWISKEHVNFAPINEHWTPGQGSNPPVWQLHLEEGDPTHLVNSVLGWRRETENESHSSYTSADPVDERHPDFRQNICRPNGVGRLPTEQKVVGSNPAFTYIFI